jgi:PTS HPr component phosphorylation site.
MTKKSKDVFKGTEIKVKLNGIEDITEFNAKCNGYKGDIDVALGRYVIDGKSVLGLYSLDISKELICKIHEAEDKKEMDSLAAALSKFSM